MLTIDNVIDKFVNEWNEHKPGLRERFITEIKAWMETNNIFNKWHDATINAAIGRRIGRDFVVVSKMKYGLEVVAVHKYHKVLAELPQLSTDDQVKALEEVINHLKTPRYRQIVDKRVKTEIQRNQILEEQFEVMQDRFVEESQRHNETKQILEITSARLGALKAETNCKMREAARRMNTIVGELNRLNADLFKGLLL